MPTQTWLYFGKRSLLDPTPKNNITQTQANAAVGWNAEDSSQFALTDTTGSPVSSSGGYRTTYQTSPGTAAEFSYRNPLTGERIGPESPVLCPGHVPDQGA